MIIPDTRKVHALLYEDTMDVFRAVSVTNEYGITSQTRQQVMSKVKCKLSMYTLSREDLPNDELGYYRPSKSIIKIFCDPSLKFEPGDWITVYRKGREDEEFQLYFEGLSNKPNVHFSHQEVEVSERIIN